MSAKELDRVGVMARVESGELKLVDAGRLLRVGYRQATHARCGARRTIFTALTDCPIVG